MGAGAQLTVGVDDGDDVEVVAVQGVADEGVGILVAEDELVRKVLDGLSGISDWNDRN